VNTKELSSLTGAETGCLIVSAIAILLAAAVMVVNGVFLAATERH